MQRTITIAADDFGLTRGITDTILETVDRGPVRVVSIIPNGETVAYAMAEYKKRSERLALAVHLNLTEGKALSAPADIPHLADARGFFRHSVTGLWLAYLFAPRAARAALRAEAHTEISAQCAAIRAALGTEAPLAVNGHQHVHLVPFVFDALMEVPGVAAVRAVQEPFQWSWSLTHLFARSVLARLSDRASRIAHLRGIATNDSFIGFVHSGHMTEEALRAGLARAKGSVEALFHPGSAREGELREWRMGRADIAWHYARQRENERKTLKTLHLDERIEE